MTCVRADSRYSEYINIHVKIKTIINRNGTSPRQKT